MSDIKVAIVHDWLTGMRGGEKCLEVFCELFPNAAVFTLLHDKGSVSPIIEKMDIRTSFLRKIPGVTKNYRNYLPFFPMAIESFDLTGYDLVLSSSHCAAKGIKIPPGALHICYCYTPVRYAWKFFDEYFAKKNPISRWGIARIMRGIKKWDLASNENVDHFIAISNAVKSRIKEFYKREADVIYPPVDTDLHVMGDADKDFYLVVSALVPYKRVDLAVKAFTENGRHLVVIGDGGDMASIKKISGENIEFLGWVGNKALADYYSKCRALVFPGEEDFGIVPLEAQSHGKPVIAYGAGGILETVVPFKRDAASASDENCFTGIFFGLQTPGALNDAVELFEANREVFNPDVIRKNACRFNRERFKQEIRAYIEDKMGKRRKKEKHANTK